MATSRAHLVQMPKHFMVLRGFQLAFSLIILGLSIFGVLIVPFASLAFTVFVAFASSVVFIWIISATSCAPKAYNYWAVLSLEIFLSVFWLIAFSLVATIVTYGSYYLAATDCNHFDYYGNCVSSYEDDVVAEYLAILAATAGLGGLMFLFSLISLITLSIMIHRHRKAGGHCKLIKDHGVQHLAYDANPAPVYTNPGEVEKGSIQPPPQAYPSPGGHYVQPTAPVAGMPPAGQHYQMAPQ